MNPNPGIYFPNPIAPLTIQEIKCIGLRQSEKTLQWGAVCLGKPFYIDLSAKVNLTQNMALSEMVDLIASKILVAVTCRDLQVVYTDFESRKVIVEKSRDQNPNALTKIVNFTLQWTQSTPMPHIVFSLFVPDPTFKCELLRKDIVFVEEERMRDSIEDSHESLDNRFYTTPIWLEAYQKSFFHNAQYDPTLLRKPFIDEISRLQKENANLQVKYDELVKRSDREKASFDTVKKMQEGRFKQLNNKLSEFAKLKQGLKDSEDKLLESEKKCEDLQKQVKSLLETNKLLETSNTLLKDTLEQYKSIAAKIGTARYISGKHEGASSVDESSRNEALAGKRGRSEEKQSGEPSTKKLQTSENPATQSSNKKFNKMDVNSLLS